MDIRHQGQGTFLAYLRKAAGGLPVGHRQAGDLTPGGGQLLDLIQAALHVRCPGIEHGLDHHRRAAANGDAADHNLSCHRSYPLKIWITSLNMMIPSSANSTRVPALWI